MSEQRAARPGPSTRGRVRRWVAGVGAGALVLAGSLVAGAAAAPAAPSPGPEEKIQAGVADELDERGRATVLVRFADRADLEPLAQLTSWDERGQAVYDALRSTADSSQADTRAVLERAGADHRPFFISNAILVRGADEALLTEVALDPQVQGVYLPTDYQPPEPVVTEPVFVPQAVEWGIANINADDVWAAYGVAGEGIVVANIDTGVDYTHPALVDHYRGSNGDGTFTHDYNWFDAAGSGSEEPVDVLAHGTHTMGTMVGSDGGANQIGVAPGARWIAANGCCPSDEALLTSGEWLLAPTDLQGQNAMPSLRPHIINNSWGSGFPSDDPFMEDVALAWEASGIFGVWSNGNLGPECSTSGAPGSRTVNYSVGAYDANDTIAFFSSRGPGQDGGVKPDISAPGVAVRSSVPGGGYEAFDGTSMAAPHVAGSVALLWSAAPDLIGDVGLTRQLLDGSAVDTADEQCGGSAEDNNVYGQGRLDALALLDSAPIGDTGQVTGTVTDGSTGDPVPGATVRFDAERSRVITTVADGTYGIRLSSGDWTVTTSRFGYLPDTATLTVPVDDTVVHDVALQPAPTGTLTGTVTDGGGQGYPLYARVSVQGAGSVGSYTDPLTGEYALTLPVGTHLVRATAQLPGYLVETREVVVVTDGTTVADFALGVDSVSCTAPGYTLVLDGLTQPFDDLTLPEGWSVEDLAGTGFTWEFQDPQGIGNETGGSGGFAVANSSAYPGSVWDATLVSPVLDASALASVTVSFRQLFDTFVNASTGTVEVSTDGGANWTPVYEVSSFVIRDQVFVDVTEQLAGSAEARVRYRYTAEQDGLWQVDDVFVGSRTCEPTGGGLVVGYVQDDVDGSGILNARVRSLDNPDDTGTTRATPDDPALEDGFYWLHSQLTGTHPFEATARNYGTDQQDVAVVEGGVVQADFVLGQAVLEVAPGALETSVLLGASDSGAFTVTNTGTSDAQVTFSERSGDFTILRADGSTATPQQVSGASGAPLVREPVQDWAAARPGLLTGSGTAPPPRTAEEPWTDLAPLPAAILDNRLVSLDGVWYSVGGTDGSESFTGVYRYDAVALEWVAVEPLPATAQSSAVAAVDGRIVVAGGWQGSGTVSSTWIYDPETGSWGSGAPMPTGVASPGAAVVGGSVVVVGGCTTGECFPVTDVVQVYDVADDLWTQMGPAPEAVAFPACGGIGGKVVCAGGVGAEGLERAQTWAYDPAGDSWTPRAAAPVAVAASAHAAANGQLLVVGGIQEGMATNASWSYDPASDVWSGLPNANVPTFRGGGACGFVKAGGLHPEGFPLAAAEMLPGYDACETAGADVDWLFLDTTEAVLAPGESVTVEVVTDSAFVNQPGTYTAQVAILANVPVQVEPVSVTMHVSPPLTWGKVTGTAYLEDCDGGQVAGDSIWIDIAPVREDVGDGWVILTDQEGRYARWVNTQLGTLRMTATLSGFRPDTHLVDLVRGGTVTQDFSLLDQACQDNPEPVPPDVVRVAGVDRYDTAARVSRQFGAGVDTVFVASGRDFPDALAAAARAGSLGGPVLLVGPSTVPAVTRIELDRLQPADVVVVGGTSTVSADVVTQLRALLPGAVVTRRGGADRYDTAARLARDYAAADVVLVASGLTFPDALAGAARAGALDAPVLLVSTDRLPSVTRAELARLAPERIMVLGGTRAVSAAVAAELGAYGAVERVAGADRYATAARLAQQTQTSQDVFVATGLDWPDALAGAARAGATDSPLLLVRTTTVPSVTWTELDRLDPGRIFVLGGPAVVSQVVVERLRTLE